MVMTDDPKAKSGMLAAIGKRLQEILHRYRKAAWCNRGEIEASRSKGPSSSQWSRALGGERLDIFLVLLR